MIKEGIIYKQLYNEWIGDGGGGGQIIFVKVKNLIYVLFIEF